MKDRYIGQCFTGIEIIDKQHEKILNMMDNILEASTYDKEKMDAFIPVFIETISEYVHVHFKTEEDFMSESGYKGAEEHIRKHSEFIAKIFAITSGYQKSNKFDVRGTYAMFKNWLLEHILSEDKNFFNYYKEYKNKTDV